MRGRVQWLWRAAAMAVGAIMAAPTMAQNTGTYLPAPGFLLGSGTRVNAFPGGATEYTVNPITDHGLQIGSLAFTYSLWSGRSDGAAAGAPDTGGGALAGGFYQTNDPNITFKNGYTKVAWVQTVRATISGNNVWNAPNNTWFPDTSDRTSPKYPFQNLPGGLNPAPANPTAGFQDFPNRFPPGPQTWLAELGLCGMNNNTHTLSIIGTFLWGFTIDAQNTLQPTAPFAWGAPTTSYVNTLTNAFSGQAFNGVTGTQWTINQDSVFTQVPAPGVVGLFGMAGLVAARRRRAA